MSRISDYIYTKFGVTVGLDAITKDTDGQALMASILVLAAQSDGASSPVEFAKKVDMISDKFKTGKEHSIQQLVKAAKHISKLDDGGVLIEAANTDLSLSYKEDLMVMVLHVIAADEKEAPGEMELLGRLIEGLQIPDEIMDRVYARYSAEKK